MQDFMLTLNKEQGMTANAFCTIVTIDVFANRKYGPYRFD